MHDGFGRELLDVITRAPNLHTFALALDIRSGWSVKGLVAALPLIKPKCFALSAIYYPQNKNVLMVQEALEMSIPNWTSLVRLL